MNVIDILLLVVIAGLAMAAVVKGRAYKQSNSCCGNCGNCCGNCGKSKSLK